MALMILAVASTANSILLVRIANEALERAKQDRKYIGTYLAVLGLGWLDVWVMWKISEALLHHLQSI